MGGKERRQDGRNAERIKEDRKKDGWKKDKIKVGGRNE
jgi:hypothetical protein